MQAQDLNIWIEIRTDPGRCLMGLVALNSAGDFLISGGSYFGLTVSERANGIVSLDFARIISYFVGFGLCGGKNVFDPGHRRRFAQ